MVNRGIALQLGQAGATVYITGRTTASLEECAREIKERGGHPIAVTMDHGVDSDVEKLFERIKSEQNGKLDLLVNNAYAGVNTIFTNTGKKFWETEPVETWDMINVLLRSEKKEFVKKFKRLELLGAPRPSS